MSLVDEKPPLDELVHFGVVGMKWGVRRRNTRIARIERVGKGKGSRADRMRVAATEVSRSSVKKHGSLQGAAANKAANMRIRDQRLAKGKGHIGDVLARHGGDRLIDTGRVDSGRKFTPQHAQIKVRSYHSETTKHVINDHNKLSNQDFFRKYATTKKTYAKRVAKHGDPFTRSKNPGKNKKAPVIKF